MPSSVNKPDAIKYLNSGYVYQTYAEERDPAGNIKLFEDATKTTNQTISVEPITSQFSVETALKLFNTRFQYFEFPVEAVQTTGLKGFDKELESEIKNTLSNTTFEQDVITRRLELIPTTKDEATDYPVALAYTFEQGIVSSALPGTDGDSYFILDRDGDASNYWGQLNGVARPTLFMNETDGVRTGYFINALNKWTDPDEVTWGATSGLGDAGKKKNFKVNLRGGFKQLRFSGGNSPKSTGTFRVTPEMIKQLTAGGQFINKKNERIWKRNLKFKFNISWRAEWGMDKVLQSADSDANGVVLFVRMTSSPESYTWKVSSEDGNGPVLAQSTSNFPMNKRNSFPEVKPYLSGLNPTQNFHQGMQFTHVVDTNDLLWDDEGASSPFGEYREYGLEVMCNYPVIITAASFDVSVDQLPEDFNVEAASVYRYSNDNVSFTPYQSKYGAWGQRTISKDGYYRENAVTSISGLREVKGKNILCGCAGTKNDIVGWVDFNGEWKSMSTYQYKEDPVYKRYQLDKQTVASDREFRFRLIENELYNQRSNIAYQQQNKSWEVSYTDKKYYPQWNLLGRPIFTNDIQVKGQQYDTVISTERYNPAEQSKELFNYKLTTIMKG